MRVETIDNIFKGCAETGLLFIKMDIEGAELRALKGAMHTIAKNFPAMAVCVYHREDDLITIPQYIKSFENENMRYEFYLRKHLMATTYELVLYALPIAI